MAANSLLYTTVAVTMLVAFVLFFSSQITRLSNGNLMHPLWDLLDDMCSMKCMEVVAENNSSEAPRMALKKKAHRCKGWSEEVAVAEELTKLAAALNHLKKAMRSWVKYVPAILFTQIFDAGIEASIGCAKTDVTVFFCDIQDFESRCEGMEPQEVLQILGMVLDRVTNSVEDFDGQMLEFIGDEILAVFNAPVPVLRHDQKAVLAAVTAQEKMMEIKHMPVRLQMGINRGHVLAGNIGSFTRMKYGVLGDGVNLAARIKSLNTRYKTSLLVCSSVMEYPRAHEEFVTRPIGNLVLKGRTVPTLIYEVFGLAKSTPDFISKAVGTHREAFDKMMTRRFADASKLFMKTNALLSEHRCNGDQVSKHLSDVCQEHIARPPPENWNGSEYLLKKAW